MNRGWLLLLAAILFEVSGTISMKLSLGFSRLIPSILVFVFYATSLSLLTLSLKFMDISLAYVVWSGLGTLLITLAGVLYFGEGISLLRLLGILLVVGGVMLMYLSGPTLTRDTSTRIPEDPTEFRKSVF